MTPARKAAVLEKLAADKKKSKRVWVADNPVSILGTPVGRSWYGSDLRKKLRAGSPTKAQHEAEKRLGVETSGHKWNP
jgi:hypothetical protein